MKSSFFLWGEVTKKIVKSSLFSLNSVVNENFTLTRFFRQINYLAILLVKVLLSWLSRDFYQKTESKFP